MAVLPLSQFAVLNKSKADDGEIAFAAKACDIQLRRDICPIWGIPYQPVSFFTTAKDLPVASGLSVIVEINETHDDPNSRAYHTFMGVPVVKIGRNLGALSVLLSHELAEESVNPTCQARETIRGGAIVAREICDAVQEWTYPIDVTIMGETRPVEVSAFVTPAWFSGADGPKYFCPGRTDIIHAGQIAPGGYMPMLNTKGVWDVLLGTRATFDPLTKGRFSRLGKATP